MVALIRAVLADSTNLAKLFNDHFLVPFADVAQVLVFVAMGRAGLAASQRRGMDRG